MKRTTISFSTLLKIVPRETFIDYYFLHSKEDTMKFFNIGSTVWNKYIKYYNIHKPKELVNEQRNLTNLIKYGCENQFQRVENIKQSYINQCGSLEEHYRKAASIAKQNAQKLGYNSLSQTPEVKAKRQQTCLDKYGVNYSFQSPKVIKKIKKTKLDKYGDENYNNIEQIKKTNLEKYGVECNFASKDSKLNGRETQLEKWGYDNFNNREKAKQTCLEKYGEDYYIKQVQLMLNSLQSKGNSEINRHFAAYLVRIGIPFDKEVRINNYVYDFKLGNYLIEIDPSITHNITLAPGTWPVKTVDYHRNKTLNALEAGFTCVHIYDWIDVELVIWGIVNKTLRIIDTNKIVRHIYDLKTKKLTNKENENTVIVCDDGFEIIY